MHTRILLPQMTTMLSIALASTYGSPWHGDVPRFHGISDMLRTSSFMSVCVYVESITALKLGGGRRLQHLPSLRSSSVENTTRHQNHHTST